MTAATSQCCPDRVFATSERCCFFGRRHPVSGTQGRSAALHLNSRPEIPAFAGMTGRRRNLEHQNLFWRSWKEILHGNVFISIDICASILIISDITGVIYKPMRANIPKIADMIMVPISARSEGKNLFIGIINSASADPGMVAAICIGSSAVRDFYWRIGGQALELVFDRSTMLRRIYGAVQSRLARTRKARASRAGVGLLRLA